MKHLKSSGRDLRLIFGQELTVRHLAEPLVSFDSERDSVGVKAFMEKKDFDIVGVRQEGVVVGYAKGTELTSGTLGEHLVGFHDSIVLDELLPVLDGLRHLTKSPRVFVLSMGCVSGIITKGDLQKAPTRLWLFGLVTLLEMQLLRLIRCCHPGDSWKAFLSTDRFEKAQSLFEERRRRNEAIDLADCLQFADKRTIALKSPELRMAVGLPSRSSGEEQLIELEALRNDLAHGQDIIAGRWPRLVALAEDAERLLSRAEEFDPATSR